MKKIIFVSTMISVPWGGSEELWSGAALQLKNEGFDVYINVKDWPEKPSQLIKLEEAGCKIERRKFYLQAPLMRRTLDKFLPSSRRFQSHFDKQQFLLRINPDLVIICQGSNQDGIDWMEDCIQLNIHFSTISQAATESIWPNDDLASRMEKVFSFAKMNFFVSERNRFLTEKQTGGKITRTKVVRNPFNVPYNVELPWPGEDLWKMACVGRVQPDAKGQDLLFEALADKSWKERNIRVSLYGRGPNTESLKRLSNYFGIESIVVFEGHVKEVSDIWKSNHALVLPSRYEGLPLSLVEASLSGRTSVVTDIAGNNEVVLDNETGFLAAAPKAELFNEALQRAWTKKHQWKEMGQRAQSYIKTKIESDPHATFAGEIKSLL